MSPWGVIVAAAITGTIAFIGMVVTKESKISEFRQAWIDSLREDVVSFITSWRGYLDSKKDGTDLGDDGSKIKFEHSIEFRKCAYRIKLRLNASQEKRSEHERKLYLLMDEVLTNQDIRTSEETIADVSLTTAEVLKEEWERVKSGEKNYTITKSFIMVLATISSSAFFVWGLIYLVAHSGLFSIPII